MKEAQLGLTTSATNVIGFGETNADQFIIYDAFVNNKMKFEN